mgnify:CR=1 FL=1
MDTVITFTPSQLFAFITAIGSAIITCGAVVALFIKLINKIKAPETEQNQRIKSLEEENKARKEEIQKLSIRLQTGDNNFKELEKTQKIILRSLQALLRHSLGSDDPGALKVAMKELDDFLVDK